MKFTESEHLLLMDICNLYSKVKTLIFYSEQINHSFKVNIQPAKELHDAFDHLMRVFVDAENNHGDELNINNNYYMHCLDKAKGHLYRSGFEALDGIYYIMRQQCFDILNIVDVETRVLIFKKYPELLILFSELDPHIAEYRSFKDTSADMGDLFDKYVDAVERLKPYHKEVITLANVFIKKKNNDIRKRCNKWIETIIKYLLIGIVPALLIKATDIYKWIMSISYKQHLR